MLTYFPQILGSAIVFASAVIIRFTIRAIVKRYLKVHSRFDLRVSHVIRVLNILINTTALMALLVVWGVDTRNLFVALSSVFAVIGVALFAQWSILSNITAGIILFFSAPFHIGDTIKILDKDMPIEATVEDIFTFYTHLRTKDGGLHIFPNSLLLQKAIAVNVDIEDKKDESL